MSNKKASAWPMDLLYIAIFIVDAIIFFILFPHISAAVFLGFDLVYFFFMFFLIAWNHRKVKIKNLPHWCSPAVPVDKIQEHRRVHTNYFLSFQLANGQKKVFQVTREDYATVRMFDSGTLTFQEDGKLLYFLKFEQPYLSRGR